MPPIQYNIRLSDLSIESILNIYLYNLSVSLSLFYIIILFYLSVRI